MCPSRLAQQNCPVAVPFTAEHPPCFSLQSQPPRPSASYVPVTEWTLVPMCSPKALSDVPRRGPCTARGRKGGIASGAGVKARVLPGVPTVGAQAQGAVPCQVGDHTPREISSRIVTVVCACCAESAQTLVCVCSTGAGTAVLMLFAQITSHSLGHTLEPLAPLLTHPTSQPGSPELCFSKLGSLAPQPVRASRLISFNVLSSTLTQLLQMTGSQFLQLYTIPKTEVTAMRPPQAFLSISHLNLGGPREPHAALAGHTMGSWVELLCDSCPGPQPYPGH